MANVEKAIDRWRRATSIQSGAQHEHAAPASAHQPPVQAQAHHPAPHHHQPGHGEPSGQNALTRGLQAALANEGLFSRNRT